MKGKCTEHCIHAFLHQIFENRADASQVVAAMVRLRARKIECRRNERGAVLLEAATCLMLLFVLAAGALEYGDLFGSTIDVSSTVRAASRAGAASTTSAPPDSAIINAALGDKRRAIDKVVIYRAESGSSGPPAACKTATTAPNGKYCDIYNASDLGAGDAAITTREATQRWPSSTRVPGTDYLGVWVSVSRPPIVNMVWSPKRYNDYFVMKIEPPVAPTSPTSITPSTNFNSGTATNPGWDWGLYCWGGSCYGAPGASTGPGSEPGGGSGGSG